MVVLNKSKMMRNAAYFGKSQARGSNKKVVNIGMQMVPFGDAGSGMSTFGNGLALHGSGMRLLGTGSLFGKLKKLAKPLLTKGKDVLKKQAASYVNSIENPLTKKLAQTGLKTVEKLVDQTMSGNTNLDNLLKITKSGARQAVKDVTGQGMRQGMRQGNNMRIKTVEAHPLEEAVGSVTDRPFLENNVQSTKSNTQLQLLKSVVRSKPLTTRTIRGKGLYTV
jgi:hypothetical protein